MMIQYDVVCYFYKEYYKLGYNETTVRTDIGTFLTKSYFQYLNNQIWYSCCDEHITIKDAKLVNALFECFEKPARRVFDFCIITKKFISENGTT